mmetsp:Transcript_975/g.2883  ORF Transcript_975/g.2883 Transcript_975/m.2883 type:complete len:236 (-) Transcript_975:165-872(-)
MFHLSLSKKTISSYSIPVRLLSSAKWPCFDPPWNTPPSFKHCETLTPSQTSRRSMQVYAQSVSWHLLANTTLMSLYLGEVASSLRHARAAGYSSTSSPPLDINLPCLSFRKGAPPMSKYISGNHKVSSKSKAISLGNLGPDLLIAPRVLPASAFVALLLLVIVALPVPAAAFLVLLAASCILSPPGHPDSREKDLLENHHQQLLQRRAPSLDQSRWTMSVPMTVPRRKQARIERS